MSETEKTSRLKKTSFTKSLHGRKPSEELIRFATWITSTDPEVNHMAIALAADIVRVSLELYGEQMGKRREYIANIPFNLEELSEDIENWTLQAAYKNESFRRMGGV